MSVARADVLRLYRGLLREGAKMKDYNVRTYVQRRCHEDFKKADVSGEQAVSMYAQGVKDLEVVRRQRILQDLYSGHYSVIEGINKTL